MVNFYTYTLPFQNSFSTSSGTWKIRNGVIIRYTELSKSIDLVSEAAPLPKFSVESIEQVIDILLQNKSELENFFHHVNNSTLLKDFFQSHSFPPSIEFAVSCIALDLISLRNPDKTSTVHAKTDKQATIVNVNAVTGLMPDVKLKSKILENYRMGYRTIKIKCAHDPENLPEIIKKSVEHLPDLNFRIDANQSWTFDEAIRNLSFFDHPSIEYCEEPISYGDLEEFLELKNHSPIPLALDESIRDFHFLEKIIGSNLAEVVVLKPTLLGNIQNLIETFSVSNTHVIKKVFTSSFESSVGLSAVARAAAIIGTRGVAHGLDTGRYLEYNLTEWNVSGGLLDTGKLTSWGTNFEQCDTKSFGKIDGG